MRTRLNRDQTHRRLEPCAVPSTRQVNHIEMFSAKLVALPFGKSNVQLQTAARHLPGKIRNHHNPDGDRPPTPGAQIKYDRRTSHVATLPRNAARARVKLPPRACAIES